MTYISWSSDSVLYLEDILVAECCTEDIDFSNIKFDLLMYV